MLINPVAAKNDKKEKKVPEKKAKIYKLPARDFCVLYEWHACPENILENQVACSVIGRRRIHRKTYDFDPYINK